MNTDEDDEFDRVNIVELQEHIENFDGEDR